MQASLVIQATRATPDGRATRAIPAIRDRRVTRAIVAGPLHARPDSILTPILTTDG
jgi:hypothetical protein